MSGLLFQLRREQKRAVIVALLGIPFICGLIGILITGDQIPTAPALWWLDRIVLFGSMLISFVLPLAIIQDSNRRLSENVVSSLLLGGLWMLSQFMAILVLGILSVILYGFD